jgi:hypothetical protein
MAVAVDFSQFSGARSIAERKNPEMAINGHRLSAAESELKKGTCVLETRTK